ncbi:MAG: helix-turn-helix domain-containing protein [Clostridia bacterium]|nr:helix-turn-helix domain-containing protein [Clostridia bacterium]
MGNASVIPPKTTPKSSVFGLTKDNEKEIIKMNTFAEQLKTMRTEAGWTRPKVVERVGVPLRTIEEWEGGRRTPPDYVQHLVLDRLALEIEKDK